MTIVVRGGKKVKRAALVELLPIIFIEALLVCA
jgi:hypothetical protein